MEEFYHGAFRWPLGDISLTIDTVEYRVYFEEYGAGIPLLMQHTAGADGRQWRHFLEKERLAQHFRMIAYDLPYHGKSVPPTEKEWWKEEYKLTKDFLMKVPVTLSHELELDDWCIWQFDWRASRDRSCAVLSREIPSGDRLGSSDCYSWWVSRRVVSSPHQQRF
jgi:pimeloyl-ACP methyl ester carboxylesterase